MPYVKSTRALAVSDGQAAALEPTVFTVKTESYALSRRLYLYTAAQPKNSAVREFVDFALSDVGQQVVKQAQFVDLDIRPQMVRGPAATVVASGAIDCHLSERWSGDREDYCKLRTSASEQLLTAFRFFPG